MLPLLPALLVLTAATPAAPAYVRSDGASLRATPSPKGKVVDSLAYGAEVTPLGPRQGDLKDTLHCAPAAGPWVKVKTAAGKTGWVWQALLQDEAPASVGPLKAVVAFRGPEEAAYGAFSDLFEDLGARCKAAGVQLVVADPAAPCVKLGPADAPVASVDVTRSLQAQGQGFILKSSGAPSRFLTPERKHHAALYAFCQAEPPKPAPLIGAARMLHLDPAEWGCAWNVYALDGGRVRTAYVSEKCPEELIWDLKRDTVTYRVSGDWLRGPWSAPGEAKPLPKPTLPADAWLGPTGVAADTGRLRVVYVQPAQVASEGGRAYVAGATRLAVEAVPGAGDAFFMVKGTHALSGTEADRIQLPDWGAPAIARLVELDPAGGWKELARVPTMCEAGEVPCASLLDPWLARGADLIHSEDLKVACNDGRTDCYAPEAMAARPELKEAVGADGEVGFLAWGEGGALFSVVVGDTPHAMPPLFACNRDCEIRTPLDVGRPTSEALSVAPRGRLLMVSDEVTQQRPWLFRAGEKAAFLRLSGVALWLPERFPPVP